jgi:predicted aldo/keto reductase-like oxidoreductase
MDETIDGLDRRQLLRAGVAATVGAAAARMVPGVEGVSAAAARTLPVRVLGGTGVELPMLAFGGVLLTSNWTRTSHEQRVALARSAYERGIRYFDTATEYIDSERVLGEALEDVRSEVFLNTKIDVVKPDYVRRTVERSLRDFRTDYIDGVQLHGTPGIEGMTVPGAMAVRDELARLKDEGMIRFVGLTGHHYFDKLHELISTGGFDTVMLACGYFRKGMWRLLSSEMVEFRELCLAKAHELGMGILAMKVMGGMVVGGAIMSPAGAARLAPGVDRERLEGLPAAAIRWVLQDPRIHLLCVGQGSAAEIDANILTLCESHELTAADRLLLAEFGAEAYPAYRESVETRRT